MKNGRRRKKEVEKSEAFHAIHEYFFFVPFSRGGRGKQTIFISLNTVNLGSRGVGKKKKKNARGKVGHTHGIGSRSLARIETIEISIPLIRGSRGFAVSAVEKNPFVSSANGTRVCTGEILAELERYSDD